MRQDYAVGDVVWRVTPTTINGFSAQTEHHGGRIPSGQWVAWRGQPAGQSRNICTRNGWLHLPEIRKPVSPAEINREPQVLRRLFSIAMKNGKLMARPTIELLEEAPARQGFFERDDVEVLGAHLPAEIQPIVRFAFITGWRISEVLKLEWGRVDFTGRGQVRLARGSTKNKEPRRFSMTIELRQLLEAQQTAKEKAERETDAIIPWVFFRLIAEGRGGPKRTWPVKSFTKAWRRACSAAGFPGRIPHDLRRLAIRVFVRSGLSENMAMALSGHKTSSVFRRYDIISDADHDDAAARLDAAREQPALATETAKRPAKVRRISAARKSFW